MIDLNKGNWTWEPITLGAFGAAGYVFARILQYLEVKEASLIVWGPAGFVLAILGLRAALIESGSNSLNKLGIIIPIYFALVCIAFAAIVSLVLNRYAATGTELNAVLREHQVEFSIGISLFVGFLGLMALLGLRLFEFGRSQSNANWTFTGVLIMTAQLVHFCVVALLAVLLMGETLTGFLTIDLLSIVSLAVDVATWSAVAMVLAGMARLPIGR